MSCPETDQAGHTCEDRERLRWQLIVESVLADVHSREECFNELFTHFGQPSSWSCFADVGPALAALSQAGYRLAVSSNFDVRLNGVMDGLPDLSRIKLRIISSLVGHRKPSPRFFESLLARAGCEPTEVLFIGDKADTDVAAANAAGIPALRIDRAATSGTIASSAHWPRCRPARRSPAHFPGHNSCIITGSSPVFRFWVSHFKSFYPPSSTRPWVAVQRNPTSGAGVNRAEFLPLCSRLCRLGDSAPRLFTPRPSRRAFESTRTLCQLDLPGGSGG